MLLYANVLCSLVGTVFISCCLPSGPMGPGQPMPGRMMPGPPTAGPPPGGIPPMMPPRHPGAPNGMCTSTTHPVMIYSLIDLRLFLRID